MKNDLDIYEVTLKVKVLVPLEETEDDHIIAEKAIKLITLQDLELYDVERIGPESERWS